MFRVQRKSLTAWMGEKASADEEYVLGNKIPLWLFGFLYWRRHDYRRDTTEGERGSQGGEGGISAVWIIIWRIDWIFSVMWLYCVRNLKRKIMNTTTITFNSLTQFRRFLNLLKTKRVTNLSSNDFYPYSITFTTKTNKRTENLLKYLHLSPIQPASYALAA